LNPADIALIVVVVLTPAADAGGGPDLHDLLADAMGRRSFLAAPPERIATGPSLRQP
jgi:hypothetical protein